MQGAPDLLRIAQNVDSNIQNFRSKQIDVILSILSGTHTVTVMATSSGKTLIWLLAGHILGSHFSPHVTSLPIVGSALNQPGSTILLKVDHDHLTFSTKPSAAVTLNASAPSFHMPPPAPVAKKATTTVTPAPVARAATTVTPAPAVGGAVRTHTGPADPPSPSSSTAAAKTGHSTLMTAADVAVAKADRAAKQLEIETANVQVCDEIALKIQELNAELKRRRDVVTVSDGSADESDDSADGDWTDAKLLEVRQQISMWHEKQQRSNHTAAAPGDSDIDRFKYDLLMKHLKSQYKQPDGSQKKGQIPSVPEQADALLSSVVANCPTCKGLCADRVERKRAWTAAEALTAKTDAEWSQRYRHRLQENEYESDGNHQGDDKCGVCRQFSGRRGKMGLNSPSRDPKDKDEL